MTATQVQSLNTGDKVKYAGKNITIVDWKCPKDIVMLGNERIWAEPIFSGLDKKPTGIHPGFWKEIEKIRGAH